MGKHGGLLHMHLKAFHPERPNLKLPSGSPQLEEGRHNGKLSSRLYDMCCAPAWTGKQILEPGTGPVGQFTPKGQL